MDNNIQSTAARAFVRSLNILLKFARMYDFGHPRTARQFEVAWSELRVAMGDDEAGLLLAVSGDKLLLDGTPLESSAAEKSFARMLSGAGIASVHFSPKLTHKSLARFVRGFPTGSGATSQLSEQLKAALEGDPHIHVNEVCFVPADAAVAKSTMAAQLAARTLGMNSEQTDQLLNDPEKLLQLIVAAEGIKSGGGEGEPRRGGPRGIVELAMGTRDVGNAAQQGFYSGVAKDDLQNHGTSDESGSGTAADRSAVDGRAVAVQGTGRSANSPGSSAWNIVGGTGGGTALDPNVGGFWLKNDAPGATAGTSLAGPIATAASSAVVADAKAGEHPGNMPHGKDGFIRRWANASAGIRSSRSARAAGSTAVETGLMTLHEDELQGILQVLAQIARTNGGPQESLDMGSFQSRLSTLPRRARFTVSQALSALAAQAPSESS